MQHLSKEDSTRFEESVEEVQENEVGTSSFTNMKQCLLQTIFDVFIATIPLLVGALVWIDWILREDTQLITLFLVAGRAMLQKVIFL